MAASAGMPHCTLALGQDDPGGARRAADQQASVLVVPVASARIDSLPAASKAVSAIV